MVHDNTLQILKRFGVEPIVLEENQVFNPDFHEVLFDFPDQEKPAGTIMHVVSHGYMIGDRVLRATKVGVTKK